MIDITFSANAFESIKDSVRAHAPNEDMAFCYARRLELPGVTRYVVQAVVILDDNDATRNPFAVSPSLSVNRAVYSTFVSERLAEQGMTVLTVHSHPFSKSVRFSAIDFATMRGDRREWQKLCPGVEFVWIVVNSDATNFDGVVVTPTDFVPIDRVTVVGKRLEILKAIEVSNAQQ